MKKLIVLILLTVIGCSPVPIEVIVEAPVENWAGSPEQIIADVTPQEASMILMDAIIEAEGVIIVGGSGNFHVIDIRSFNECDVAGVISTMQVPVDQAYYKSPGQFKIRVNYLHKDRTYLIYGQTGSGEALAIMEELGFREVYNILGGFESWSAEGLPTAIFGSCGAGDG